MPTLADLYDPDKRARSDEINRLAAKVLIPYPLKNTAYAEGAQACTCAKKHQQFQVCRGAGVFVPHPTNTSPTSSARPAHQP